MTSSIISQETIRDKKLAKREYDKLHFRSKDGLVAKIYKAQRCASRRRGHPMPDYNLKELRAWVFSQPNFETLYQNWIGSGFNIAKVPSCDRLDDYLPYTLSNLRIVTWAENNARGCDDRKKGINNKSSKAVIQLTKDGAFVSEHHSINHAGRVTDAKRSAISGCCHGERKTAGGFVWVFSGDQ